MRGRNPLSLTFMPHGVDLASFLQRNWKRCAMEYESLRAYIALAYRPEGHYNVPKKSMNPNAELSSLQA